jgi:GTPase KRas protein
MSSNAIVEIIDTGGSEEFRVLLDELCRRGQGFFLIYSVTSRSSFDELEVRKFI